MSADRELVESLRGALAEAGDPSRAEDQQRYMKSAMPYYGVTSPRLKALLRPLLAAHAPVDRVVWEDTTRVLWDEAGHREERYAALAWTRHPAARGWQDPDALVLYRHLIVTGAWWDLVDEIAGHQVGGILCRHRETVTPLVRGWAVDEELWLRRTAVLSQLRHGPDTDTTLLHEAIAANLDDTSFWLRKAIGWALRQYARTDPAWVRAEVARCGPRLSGLSRREALKHLG